MLIVKYQTKYLAMLREKITMLVLLVAVGSLGACDSKQHSNPVETKKSERNCNFTALTELVGKREKDILECYEMGGGALIGKENEFSTTVLRKNDQFILILSRMGKDADFVVKDAMQLPKLVPNETILYGSCYTNSKSGVVDAVAIADYVEHQQFLIPKQSWIIDFESARIKPASNSKVTCVNESYGV
jgi:hypothetical protein